MCALKAYPDLLSFQVRAQPEGEDAQWFYPTTRWPGLVHMAFRIRNKWHWEVARRVAIGSVEIESEVKANDGYSLYFRDRWSRHRSTACGT